MGFFYRKSVNFGPFRVNLSKSGVGYSVGGRGFPMLDKFCHVLEIFSFYVDSSVLHNRIADSVSVEMGLSRFRIIWCFARVANWPGGERHRIGKLRSAPLSSSASLRIERHGAELSAPSTLRGMREEA